MTILEVLLLAASMASDAFAVCLAAGALPGPHGPGQAFRLAFRFGLFLLIMPIIAWLAGTGLEPLIRDVDHWMAFALLAYVRGRMLHSAWQARQVIDSDPARGWTLVMLSIAVSIDALAVGLNLGLVGVPVVYPAC
jgi:putative Mn2+ efflux pump MntP